VAKGLAATSLPRLARLAAVRSAAPHRRREDRRSAAVAGRAALDSFEALFRDDGQHAERGQRIGPPPTERPVEEKATEEDGREVAAERRLSRIGGEGAAAHPHRDAALGAGEERHAHERENRQRDAWKALRRSSCSTAF